MPEALQAEVDPMEARRLFSGTLLVAQESRRRHREGFGNSRYYKKAWVPLAPLDAPEIRQVNLSIERKLLLCDLALLSQPTNIPPKYRLPILSHLQNGTRSGI